MGPQPCLPCAQCRARAALSPEPHSPRAGPTQPFIRMRGCGSVPSLPQLGPSRTPGPGWPCSVSLRVLGVLCGGESSLISWISLRPCPGLGLVSTGRSSETLAGSVSCLAPLPWLGTGRARRVVPSASPTCPRPHSGPLHAHRPPPGCPLCSVASWPRVARPAPNPVDLCLSHPKRGDEARSGLVD